MDDIPYPFEVDGGVFAVVLEQRDRHAWNRSRFHVREGFFENRKTTYAHDRVDFSGLDDGHYNGGPFGAQHGIAKALGFLLKFLNRAEAAIFAEQAEFI